MLLIFKKKTFKLFDKHQEMLKKHSKLKKLWKNMET